jgi:hypothetical protein
MDRLAAELCFRFDQSPDHWVAVLRSIRAWDPRLSPVEYDRRTDLDAFDPEPWSDAHWPVLANKLSGRAQWSYTLFGTASAATAWTLGVGRVQTSMSLIVPQRTEDLIERFIALLTALVETPPALAMGFAHDTADDRFLMQGLHRLTAVPPLLYFDPRSVELLGGMKRLREAPCEKREVTPGSMLFIAESLPWGQRAHADASQRAALERVLGISAERPLVLLADDVT